MRSTTERARIVGTEFDSGEGPWMEGGFLDDDPGRPNIPMKGTVLNWRHMPLGYSLNFPKDRLHWIRQGETYEQGWQRVREEREAAERRKRIILWS